VVGGRVHNGAHMIGGPALAAVASLRAGAGLARLLMPEPALNFALVWAPTVTGMSLPVDLTTGEIIAHEAAAVIDAALQEAACLAIGPGLGTGDGPRAASLRAVWQREAPVVVDADAINNLAQTPDLPRDFHAAAILTPHPGEYRRLAKSLNLAEMDPVEPNRRSEAAESLAQRLGCVVALKGARTVVSDGQRTWVDQSQNAALATAGTGDVLTGLIAGLVAQFHRRPIGAGSRTIISEQQGGLGLFDLARLGVRAHALAADRWRQRTDASAGLLATDLLDEIPAAVETLRAS